MEKQISYRSNNYYKGNCLFLLIVGVCLSIAFSIVFIKSKRIFNEKRVTIQLENKSPLQSKIKGHILSVSQFKVNQSLNKIYICKFSQSDIELNKEKFEFNKVYLILNGRIYLVIDEIYSRNLI